MTVTDLKVLAKKNKVDLPAGAKKDDIIKALAKGNAGMRSKVKAEVTVKATAKTKAASKDAAAKQVATAAKKKATEKKPVSPGPASARKKTAVKKAPSRKAPAKKAPPAGWKMPEGLEEPLMAQERVSFAKFFTGAPEHLLKTSHDALPSEYGRERIAMLARDPDTVFAYWEVPQERVEKERAGFGGDSRLCIRIYDVTGVAFDGMNASAYYDQEVYERVGSWYFDLQRPGRKFCADIGLRTADGRFLTIARSNAAAMPRDAVSDVIDEQWTFPEGVFAKLYGVPGWAVSGMSSQEIQEMLRQRRMAADVTSPGAKAGRTAKRK
jgi:hypothetical protein